MRPYGSENAFFHTPPAMNCRAIFMRPYGTENAFFIRPRQ
ncbi:Uncharacterized protein dnm_002070 [Desulfonema magnum]|uniref:Uncharacterized protein n=1 Tax=Desulfonema magnum TaxID=45655 RepID=A0A975BFA3_9BACT|nr:Uncharacterized protein dnm_002070 [Desulfonema magnum]